MILSWMLHASALTLLLVLAAASLETTARQQGWPVRGLWIGAGLGSIALSALAVLLPERDSVAAARLIPAPVAEAAAGLAWLGSQPASAPPLRLELWLLVSWGIASAAIVAAIGISRARLRRRSREWVLRNVDGRDVWVSGDTGPAVVGVLRSRIVIPDWVLESDPGDRSLALAHEEEHIRARDPQLLCAALLLLAALPWNLPLWWLWRRLRQAVELDCDHRVLARGLDPRAYSRLLVNVAQWGNHAVFSSLPCRIALIP
jgi:beta-lactamase regulating signal transducer with metallopeptidase domain